MKRKQRGTSNISHTKVRTLDPGRLTGVRGGGGLGIAVEEVGPPPPFMQNQHNETLIGL
jgi:hypothetical protein